jgi:hypothetical protein
MSIICTKRELIPEGAIFKITEEAPEHTLHRGHSSVRETHLLTYDSDARDHADTFPSSPFFRC